MSISVSEEQKKLTADVLLYKENVRKEVYDNGYKRMDVDILVSLTSANSKADSMLRLLDTIFKKDKVKREDLTKLEISIKVLEDSISIMVKKKSYGPKPELLSSIREEYFPLLIENDLNTKQGKLLLVRLRNELLLWQRNMTEGFGEMLGSSCNFGFYQIHAFAEPESELVEEGSRYKANLFWATTIPVRPEVKVNDSIIIPKYGVVYKISFKTTPGNYDENGLCKKQWKGTYTYFNHLKREDTTVVITKDYFVKRIN